MAQAAGKLHMKTTKFGFNGKPVTVGILRKFNNEERVPLLETPRVVEAANAKYGTNLRVIRHTVLDYLLTKTDNWWEIHEVFPCPAGEGLAYEKPFAKLGKQIIFAEEGKPRVIVPTGKYRAEKGIALVVPRLTADDIKKDGKDIVLDVPDTRLIAVPEFSIRSGWHMPHEDTGIPSGKKVEFSSEARGLWRRDSSCVCLPVRGGDYGDGRQDIYAHLGPSNGCGVAVEVPEEDVQKLKIHFQS